MNAELLEWIVVPAFGAMVGVGELLSRFSWGPEEALKTVSFWLYVAVNALAAGAALVVIKLEHWTFGVSGGASVELTQILVAGFGAMALFRSALFTFHVGDSVVAIGPLVFLQVLLDTAERSVRRRLAADLNQDALRWLQGIAYDKAKSALPQLCTQLSGGITDADHTLITRTISSLDQSSQSDHLKALELGLVLIRVFGDEIVLAATNDLREDLSLAAIAPSSAWLRLRSRRGHQQPPSAGSSVPQAGAQGTRTSTP